MASIKVKLTESVLKNIPLEITKINDTEISGFYLNIGKANKEGKRSQVYYLYYRLGGRGSKERRLALGNSSVITVSEARQLAKQYIGDVSRGIDVFLQKKKAVLIEKQESTSPTIAVLANEFIERDIKANRKDVDPVIRMFEKDILPFIGSYKLKEITRREIFKKVLDPITDRGAKTQANKTLSILKQMFNFGVERDLIQGNPISTVKKKSVGGLEKSRTRALEFEEVIQVFERLPKLGISQQVIYALKCITLTGCRPVEVTGAQWPEFDFEKMIWTIPAERVKQNKDGERTHKVPPITQNMVILLDELRAAFGYLNSKYVFPSTTTNKSGPGEQPIDRHSLSRSISRKLEQLGVPKFVPHDLRRTVATRLGDDDIGTDPIVIEKILNYQLQGVQGVYNMQEYMGKRRNVLMLWGVKFIGVNKNQMLFEE
ncbi:tyrosine-type recombinase/integrase [Pseudoalteromonas rhizosphaerae]|uniref:Tyrosine-type recombinase/integrase n=1 Tax=Pseudoalteromonas rhizosphaerae TaxID=2518973 RepID=A0ABW8KUV5_9GAMM